MATYSYAQIEGAWINAGGPSNVAPIMAAIAEAESGGSDVIQQGQPYSSTGWGVWQITPGNSVPSAGVDNQLLTLATNAKAAVAKYQSQGLGAWTTYTSGEYNKFMQSNVTPVATQASAASGTGVSSTIAGTLLSGLMDALGISDVKDFLERGAFIVFGAVLILIGLFYVTNVGSKTIQIAQTAKAVAV